MYKTTSSIHPYVNFEKETLHLFSEFIAVANCLIFNELDVRDSGTRMFLFLNLQLDLFFFTPNQPSAEFFFHLSFAFNQSDLIIFDVEKDKF